MFRAAVLTIVLTLSAGPSATLLCKTWCNPQSAAGRCHDTTSAGSTSVAANHKCDDAGFGAAALIPEGGLRSVSAPERHHAVLGPRHHLANPAADRGPRGRSSVQSSLEKRPLTTNLRI